MLSSGPSQTGVAQHFWGTISQGSLPENVVNGDNGRHDDDAVDVDDGDADSDDGDDVDSDHEGDDDDGGDHEGDDVMVMMLAVYYLRNIDLSSHCGRGSVS